ncbi:metallophosphoesterase family protein [Sphingomonas canadensis]|uniref:Metallophosphoesterase family protein n=1 Tax=Sphingomonas canadensis TaxID=1219257 RepID=A0ABW3H732_9SPHN|nr:metallophosphoesterase [Sphingomonas canadensis]MCW3837052.1 metallophosphoesterase [Sphingomonas canadensis]
MTRLFHVSDLHFGAEDRAALDWFAGLVAAEAPDAIVVTGDLTLRARAREFAAAAAWLQGLGRPVTVEAGNHDLPWFNPWARLVAPYRRYRALEAAIERPLGIAGVSVVPLKTTARAQWRLDWSKGHVSGDALRRTLALVAATPAGGLRFVACHHPLVEPGTRMSSRTRGGGRALAALAAAGVDAVLTGHVHDPFDHVHRAGGRAVRMIGAGTLSERIRAQPPGFNEIRIAGREFETVARTMA